MKKFRGVFIKNDREISLIREANRIGALILDELETMVHPGIKTMEFERKTRQLCEDMKVTPASLGYAGFPYALCCSVNEVVVHGFPSDRVLQEGDIVSFDLGVIHEGFYSDSARTIAVGEISPEAQRLLRITEESLALGIAEARPGNELNDICRAVQQHVEAAGFSVVKRFVGHGVGVRYHEKPEVPNFVAASTHSLPLMPGMVLAIEPMVCAGGEEVEILPDEWTAVTKDGSLSAHFEHSVAITANGPEILSLSPRQKKKIIDNQNKNI